MAVEVSAAIQVEKLGTNCAEDNHGIGIHVLSFLRQKQTTGRRLHTEHAEEVSGDVVSHEPVCPATGAEAVNADLISREIGEDARGLPADHAVVWHRKLILRVAMPLLVGKNADLLGMHYRHGPQDEPVHQTENRGVGADSQRQRKHRDNRKRRALAQHAHPVQDIVL